MEPITQPAAIDVSGWELDDLFFNYPEGARSKYAYFAPEGLDLDFILSSRRYLYKRSNKKYPDQFWGEIVAYHVGCELGVVVPPTFAAFDSETGTSGALSEWFYEDDMANFVSGGNFMQMIDAEYDRKIGDWHNFRWVEMIALVYARTDRSNDDWRSYWSQALLFDALIGNTDRHQDNWGYLLAPLQGPNRMASLSPLFDNGTSMGNEKWPHLLVNWNDADYERYIAKGTHHMRWEKDDPKRCGHIEMIRRIAQALPETVAAMRQMIDDFSLEEIRCKLEYFQELQVPIPLSKERAGLYMKLLTLRKHQLEVTLA